MEISTEFATLWFRFTPMTQEYLSYLFNKEVGENFSIFLKKYRIHKAKELLLESDLKTYEIAEKVGYSDVKYFLRITLKKKL